jgi:hypothetical protein
LRFIFYGYCYRGHIFCSLWPILCVRRRWLVTGAGFRFFVDQSVIDICGISGIGCFFEGFISWVVGDVFDWGHVADFECANDDVVE